MRIQLTKQECIWLADLAGKARSAAELANLETPHPLLELRRDNMATLEKAINAAIAREMQRSNTR